MNKYIMLVALLLSGCSLNKPLGCKWEDNKVQVCANIKAYDGTWHKACECEYLDEYYKFKDTCLKRWVKESYK